MFDNHTIEIVRLESMQVIRQGNHLTASPELNDLTLRNGTLYVLLWKSYDPQQGRWNLGWYPVEVAPDVMNYLFGR